MKDFKLENGYLFGQTEFHIYILAPIMQLHDNNKVGALIVYVHIKEYCCTIMDK